MGYYQPLMHADVSFGEGLTDLIARLLRVAPDQRLSIAEAAVHPWIASSRTGSASSGRWQQAAAGMPGSNNLWSAVGRLSQMTGFGRSRSAGLSSCDLSSLEDAADGSGRNSLGDDYPAAGGGGGVGKRSSGGGALAGQPTSASLLLQLPDELVRLMEAHELAQRKREEDEGIPGSGTTSPVKGTTSGPNYARSAKASIKRRDDETGLSRSASLPSKQQPPPRAPSGDKRAAVPASGPPRRTTTNPDEMVSSPPISSSLEERPPFLRSSSLPHDGFKSPAKTARPASTTPPFRSP